MGTVSIGSSSYAIYGTQAGAVAYHGGNLAGASFTSADSTTQRKALVSASRMILRAGPVDPDTGVAITPSTAPPVTAVDEASYELALALIVDPTIASSPGSGSNVKRQRDKVGELESETEYFRSTLLVFGRFPQIVQELLGPYLPGAGSSGAPYASGVDVESAFEGDDWGFTGEGLP